MQEQLPGQRKSPTEGDPSQSGPGSQPPNSNRAPPIGNNSQLNIAGMAVEDSCLPIVFSNPRNIHLVI